MKLEELKKLREQKKIEHKKKKKAYYLKSKAKKAIDYEDELKNDNFALKIKEIAKAQKLHVDNRLALIIAKMDEYKKNKQEYYLENKDKRLEYDKQYREQKKEELKEYRRNYYQKNRSKILKRQKENRLSNQKEQ